MSKIKAIVRRIEGKALPNHPALYDSGSPVSIYDPNRSGTRAATLSQREAKRHLQAYGGNEAIDWVTTCVNFIMETASAAPYHFVQNGVKHLQQFDRNAPDAPFVDPVLGDVFKRPNPHMDFAELLELTIIDYLLVGNGYWYKRTSDVQGRTLDLYRLCPEHVKIVPGPYGPLEFEYAPIPGREPLKIKPYQMVHFKRPNPHSAYYGLGLIQQAGRSADMELAITETIASYYEKGAHPSLVVQSDKRVPRDVKRKLLNSLRARNAGARNAGELMVLEAGLKATTISANAMEAAFEQISRMSRDRVFSWFRLNPKLVGLLDERGQTDKIGDAQRVFDTKMMRPLLDKFQKRISAGVTEPYGYEFTIEYEYQMAVEDRWKLISTIGAVPGLTVDELRGLAGLPPHVDKTIGTMTLNLPGENAGTGQPGDTPTRNGFPDRPLAGEPGRPPKSSNTKAFPRGGAAAPKGAAVTPSGKSLSIEELLETLDSIEEPEGKASRVIASTFEAEPPADLLADRRDPDVDVIIADLTRDLQDASHTLERSLLDHVDGKALGTGLRRRIERSRAWTTFTQTITHALEKAVKRAVSTAASHHSSIGLQPDEDLDYDAIAKGIVYRRGGVRQIAANLRRSVLKTLADAQENTDVEKLVREQIKTWQESQASLVAETEAQRGYNEGTLSVAEATGHSHVGVSDGHDHDEACKEADGAIWTIEEARKRPLEHPRCRRAFVPVPLVAG